MTIGGVEFDLRLTLLIIYSTVVPMLDHYGHRITGVTAYDRFIVYFLLPVAIIVFLFRESPAAYGLRIGDWRTGLMWTLIGITGMAIILYFLARTPTMEAYYQQRAPDSVWTLAFRTGVEMLGWEFIWRGLLLFAFARAFGPGPAIFLQAVPFAFMHLGKPEFETLTTIFGGAAFGWVAWQSGSFLYPFLIHWFMVTFTMLVATGRI
ncbi:MAG: CPBP family intramembrane glutamic endopeptidase [Candidatus Promineifilaceae bacterium]|nr:CPBP family intramembrane glutamic endopeptidase [Candidatus Promineifilaceae bacterium]